VLLGDRGSVLKSFFIVFTLSHREAALQASSCTSGFRVLRDYVYFGIPCTSGSRVLRDYWEHVELHTPSNILCRPSAPGLAASLPPGDCRPGYRLFRPFGTGACSNFRATLRTHRINGLNEKDSRRGAPSRAGGHRNASSLVEVPVRSMVREAPSGSFDSAPKGVLEENIFVALRSGRQSLSVSILFMRQALVICFW
jgi:hypothetical protein